jgi:hypothetical protein
MGSFRWSWPRILIAALAGLALWIQAASAETVLARRRLGNNTEALTYDPLNDRAVALDGTDIIGIALNPLDGVVLATMREPDDGIGGPGFRKLFDVLGFDPSVRDFKGIVFVPTQSRYYFGGYGPENATKFFSTNAAGHPLPTLNLRGLDTSDWVQWEGMAWIPPNAPAHGGTIAALGIRGDFLAHVFFVRLDGTIEAEVIPQPGTPLESYLCAIQYWPQHPRAVLLTNCGVGNAPGNHGQVYAMDIRTGALIGDPSKPLITMVNPGDCEGIVVRRNGEILLSDYETGRLSAFDSALNPTPGKDRLFVVGLGVSLQALTWNFDTGEFNILSRVGLEVFAVSRDLRSARVLFDVDVNHEVDPAAVSGITYLGAGQFAISNRSGPSGIDIADTTTGFSLSRLLFLPPTFPAGPASRPFGIGLLGADQFLVRVRGDPTALLVVSRTGTPNTDFFPDGVVPTRFADLRLSAPTQGMGAQVFDSGQGPRIFTGNEIYDISGNLLHVIDADQLGLVEPPGKWGVWLGGNTFANVDGNTSTLVVYSVP